MGNQANTSIEIIKIITGFLSNNFGYILILTLLIICRDAISNLIERLTNFKWKKGDSEIGVEAAAPHPSSETSSSLDKAIEPPRKLKEDQEIITKEEEVQEQNWFSKMHSAFDDGRIDDAQAAFKEYALEEKDPVKLEENKAFFLYFLFKKGKDNSAITQLENLANTSANEESKYTILIWLSFCLRDSSQIKAEIELWKKAVESFQFDKQVTCATVNLAHALNLDGRSNDAKNLLTSRLQNVSTQEEKSNIFSALSQVEITLGNNKLSIYCKDKSLEFDPNNRDELFNSAYQASKEDVDEISISNYITLLRLDQGNSTALNNLAVLAQEADLKVKAVEKYKEASDFNSTLAMANQGYLLLNAGFVEEAERIAKKAAQMEAPHKNVYSLLSRIGELQKEQDSKWLDLIDTSKARQKFIRNYANAYYLGKENNFEGQWTTEKGNNINITISGDILQAVWQETMGLLSNDLYRVEISGKVTMSSFNGRYKKMKENGKVYTGLLGLSSNKDIACIGVLSDDGSTIRLVAEDYKNDFSMLLKREKA